MRLFGGGSFATVGVERGRQILAELRPPGGVEVASVEDWLVPGDPPVGVRTYHPSPGERLPVLVWVHGGGWCLGGLDSTDRVCRELSAGAECLVVSIDHRRAPEHPYPEPVDDVAQVLGWVLRNGSDIGGDPTRVTISGESAGANLAVAACMRILEGPRPAHQILVVPVVDLEADRPSMLADADPNMPVRDLMWFAEQYVPHGVERAGLISPLVVDALGRLPPATIVTAELDPLRDGGQALVDALRGHGVAVEHLDYSGVGHGFFAAPGDATGRQALDDVIAALRAADGAG